MVTCNQRPKPCPSFVCPPISRNKRRQHSMSQCKVRQSHAQSSKCFRKEQQCKSQATPRNLFRGGESTNIQDPTQHYKLVYCMPTNGARTATERFTTGISRMNAHRSCAAEATESSVEFQCARSTRHHCLLPPASCFATFFGLGHSADT